MIKLQKEFSFSGNDEFWIEILEADDKTWVWLASQPLGRFFFFWSKLIHAEALPIEDLLAEIADRLHDVHEERDNFTLKDLVMFQAPGWDRWSHGTPGTLDEYLYGKSASSPPNASA